MCSATLNKPGKRTSFIQTASINRFSFTLISGLSTEITESLPFLVIDYNVLRYFDALRTFARKFASRWNFFKFLLQSDHELLVSEMQGVTMQGVTMQGVTMQGVTMQGVTMQGVTMQGVTSFVSEIKRVENYPDPHFLFHNFNENNILNN